MTTDALLNIVVAVVIPGIMGLIGGILAVVALPDKSRWKIPGVSSLGVLFLVSVVLAFVQQIRDTAHQREAAQATAAAELRTTGEAKYTQGQLDSIAKVLASLVTSHMGDTNLRSVLQGLLQSAQSRPPGASPGVPVPQPTPSFQPAPTEAIQPTESSPFATSVHDELERLSGKVMSIGSEWRNYVMQVNADSVVPYKVGSGTPPSELPDDFVQRLVGAQNQLEDKYRALQPQIQNARGIAIAHLHLTRAEIVADDAAYKKADGDAETENTTAELKSYFPNVQHFDTMAGYLSTLAQKIGNGF